MNVYKNLMCSPADHLATIYIKSKSHPTTNPLFYKKVDISELNADLELNKVWEYMPNEFAPNRQNEWLNKPTI